MKGGSTSTKAMSASPAGQRTSAMLREARRQAGLSLAKLGGEAKIPPARIHRLETEYGTLPRPTEASLLARRLGIDLTALHAAIRADREAELHAADQERTARPLPGGR